MKKIWTFYTLFLSLVVVKASKCPEARKPHPTSCTIFYNCVNLPSGGFVWAPAKCTNGLIFQPYLRMCVLPGDAWTCDTLTTDPPLITKEYTTPELIDPTQSSYLGYTDGLSGFNNPIDSSYSISDDSDPNDSHPMTPYPLIEDPSTSSRQTGDDIDLEQAIRNLGVPIAIKHSEDNYLYRLGNGQQVPLLPSADADKEQLINHLTWLSRLIDRLLIYQGLGIPLDRQESSPGKRPVTRTTATTESPIENTLKANQYALNSQNSALLNYLVQNYVLKNNLQGTTTPITTVAPAHLKRKASSKRTTSSNKTTATTRAPITKNNIKRNFEDTLVTADKSNVDIIINGPKADNNIIVIVDTLGNKQYATIDRYKNIARQLTTETVDVIACTKGVRLPNTTDCTKYYSCDPQTAFVMEFSCPSYTAFNEYTRVCNTQRYTACVTNINSDSTLRISVTTSGPNVRDAAGEINVPQKNPCQSIGKYGDPTSDSHYYLCFTGMGRSTDIKSIRMTCPNDLIFCAEKKVCTTKRRCV